MYGDFTRRSLSSTRPGFFPSAYVIVGSAISGIPIFRRLRYTAATTGRSSSRRTSRSTMLASVTMSCRVSFMARACSVHSGFQAFSNSSTIMRTASRAVVLSGKVYVSGKR